MAKDGQNQTDFESAGVRSSPLSPLERLDPRVEEVVSPKEFESDFYGVQLGMVVVSNCAFIVSQILWLQSLLL